MNRIVKALRLYTHHISSGQNGAKEEVESNRS